MQRSTIVFIVLGIILLFLIVCFIINKYLLKVEANVIEDKMDEDRTLQSIMRTNPSFLQYRKALKQSELLRNETLYRSFQYYTFLKDITMKFVPTSEEDL